MKHTLPALGIDPDLHATGIALASVDRVYGVWSIIIPQKFKREQAVIMMSRALALELPRFFPGLMQHYEKVNGPPPGKKAIDWSWHPRVGAIEYPVIYPPKMRRGTRYDKVRPNDIKNLAMAGAAALGVCHAEFSTMEMLLPTPRDWKGTREKKVTHKHILNRLGWTFAEGPDYCYPIKQKALQGIYGAHKPTKTQWSHCVDAIGIAQWAATKYASKS